MASGQKERQEFYTEGEENVEAEEKLCGERGERGQKLRAQQRLSLLRPLNRAVKFQASGSIRRLNSLAANRVFQTDAYNLRASRFDRRM